MTDILISICIRDSRALFLVLRRGEDEEWRARRLDNAKRGRRAEHLAEALEILVGMYKTRHVVVETDGWAEAAAKKLKLKVARLTFKEARAAFDNLDCARGLNSFC